ncbi:MAG: hypothetical protein H7839_02545 [Magnetococcus sp. YQC-5]
MSTLFGRMALRFGTHPENIAVEALHDILSCDSAKKSFLDFLSRMSGMDMHNVKEIKREKAGEQGERPDLTFWDESGQKLHILEAKFWAGLQDTQPVGYLNSMNARPSILVFLSPKNRFEHLWHDLENRCLMAKYYYWNNEQKKDGFWTVSPREGQIIALTSWDIILSHISENLSANESNVNADVYQLKGLCEVYETPDFLPLTQHELDDRLIPRRILNYCNLVYKIISLATKKLKLNKGQLNGTYDYYGACVNSKKLNAWLGISYEKWRDYGLTPIWLQAYNRFNENNKLIANLPQWSKETSQSKRFFVNKNGSHFIALTLPLGCLEDKVIDNVITQLEEILKYC